MMQLTCKTVYVQQAQPAMPPPAQIQYAKPLSYEFRIHETVAEGKITKVKLQVQVWEHDELGYGSVRQTWTDVPRFQFDETGQMINPLVTNP